MKGITRVLRLATAFKGFALAAIAAFCIYRILLFRPLPLDSPGTLRPILYSWFRSYTGLFTRSEDAYSAWHIACYAVLLAFPLLALLNYLWQRKTVRLPHKFGEIFCSQGVFWSLYGTCLILCRYPVLLRNELNPDEGQFLASAHKLFYDPNFFRAVDCHTSGPGNIFPLMAPAIFGLSPDFASSRIVALIALFLSVYLLYRSVALIARDDLARIAILPVAIVFPVFMNRELVYHSSEHLPILLVSFALFLSVRIFVRPEAYRVPAFLLGLTASAAFFTKLQSIPIIAAAILIALGCLFASNSWSARWRAPLLVAAGAVPLILLNISLCLKAGVWHDFWRSYVVANIEYTGSRASLRESIPWFLRWTAEHLELRSFFYTVLVIALASLAYQARVRLKDTVRKPIPVLATATAIACLALLRPDGRLLLGAFLAVAAVCLVPAYFVLLYRKGSLGKNPGRWFGLLASLSSVAAFFSAFAAQRTFTHYLLFLFVPLGTVVAWTLVRQVGRVTILPHLTVAATLVCSTYLWSFQDSSTFDVAPMIRAREGDFIRTVTSPGDRIYVWGWTALPYLASGRIPATRQTLVGTLFRSYNVMTAPPVVQPTPASERVTAYYRSRELRDLQENPPALFIDAIGPTSWFLYSREYYGFEKIPEIAAFVNAEYVHLVDLYEQRYFLRRDLAARREAEFNRPLPPKACTPWSVRCLDQPVTLPHALPPVQMPAHARIEAIFMPIGSQIGTATIFNNEAQPNSFRGFRLQHVANDRYILLVGLGDSWAVSREFVLPEGRSAFFAIELNEHSLTIVNNGSKLDELHLARPMADSPGPITIGSWIQGMAPFSGKIQFFQIVDLSTPSPTSSAGEAFLLKRSGIGGHVSACGL